MKWLRTAVLVTLAAALALIYTLIGKPDIALAQSPWFVIVEDGDQHVVVDNREQPPLHVVAGTPQHGITLDDLAGRPSADLWLVFGTENDVARVPATDYSLARFQAAGLMIQTARFYPAIEDGEPASFVVWDLVRTPSPNGYRVHEPSASDLETLDELGMEVLVSNGDATLPLAAITASLVLAVAIAAAGARWLTRSR